MSPAQLTPEERREVERKCRMATLEALSVLGGEAHLYAIRERALMAGGFTDRELSAPVPGGRLGWLVDDRLRWALPRLKTYGLVENPRPGIWRLTDGRLARAFRNAAEDVPANVEPLEPRPRGYAHSS